MEIKRGEIYYADLSPVIGCEQGGIRPVLIIQNDVGNHYSPTVIAAAITSRKKKRMPTHVLADKPGTGTLCKLSYYARTGSDNRPHKADAVYRKP